MKKRILGSIVVLISIIFLPYWVYIPMLFIGVIVFPLFWEGIIFALLIDTIYGVGVGIASAIISPLALIILIALVVFMPFRDSLRLHV